MTYDTPYRIKNGKPKLDPLVVHRFREAGISKSLLRAWLKRIIPLNSIQREIFVARAWDNHNSTTLSEKFPQVIDLPVFLKLE